MRWKWFFLSGWLWLCFSNPFIYAGGLAEYRVGGPNGTDSLRIQIEPSHTLPIEEINGRAAVRVPAGSYLGVDIPEWLAYRTQTNLYVEVDYLDFAYGCIQIEYNAVPVLGEPFGESSYQIPPFPPALLTDSGQWMDHTWLLPEAECANRQEGGFDLRIYAECGFVLSSIRISSDPIPFKGTVDLPVLIPELAKEAPLSFDVAGIAGVGVSSWRGPESRITDLESRLPLLRLLGIRTLQTLIRWNDVQSRKDQFDWTRLRVETDLARKNQMKCMVLLDLCSQEATPKWFNEEGENFPLVDSQWGVEARHPSLWNPFLGDRLRIIWDSFVSGPGSDVDGLILGLGPDGMLGFAGSRVTNPGIGFWAMDAHACHSFEEWLEDRYEQVDILNARWKTGFRSFAEVYPQKPDLTDPAGRKRWLDTVHWYEESLEAWANKWMNASRTSFPSLPVFIRVAGDLIPSSGVNPSLLARDAGSWQTGTQVVVESGDYPLDHALSRWFSTASRFYHSSLRFEAARTISDWDSLARIYNATVSGCSGIVTLDRQLLSSKTASLNHLKFDSFLQAATPEVSIAVFVPRTDHILNGERGFYARIATLRDLFDYDLLDGRLIQDGALQKYKALIIVEGYWFEDDTISLIQDWVRSGGVLITSSSCSPHNLDDISFAFAPGIVSTTTTPTTAMPQVEYAFPEISTLPPAVQIELGRPGDGVFLDEADWQPAEWSNRYWREPDRFRWTDGDSHLWFPLKVETDMRCMMELFIEPKVISDSSPTFIADVILNGTNIAKISEPGFVQVDLILPSRIFASAKNLNELIFSCPAWTLAGAYGLEDQRSLGIAVNRIMIYPVGTGVSGSSNGLIRWTADQTRIRECLSPVGKGFVGSIPYPLGERFNVCLIACLRKLAEEVDSLKELNILDGNRDDLYVSTMTDGRILILNLNSNPMECSVAGRTVRVGAKSIIDVPAPTMLRPSKNSPVKP